MSAKPLLHRVPVPLVDARLVGRRQVHQHEVPDEVRLGELLAGGVHRLEDELRVVDPSGELEIDDHELSEAEADCDEVGGGLGELLGEELVAVEDPAPGAVRPRAAPDYRFERISVGLREQELEGLVAALEGVGEVEAADLLG